ncbi:MAG TPA: hypothetical protein VFQ44_10540 [Streptosporangiaceae bacterium]|nr:hypothetical protein [Streptosporangiaceae bacterium]
MPDRRGRAAGASAGTHFARMYPRLDAALARANGEFEIQAIFESADVTEDTPSRAVAGGE